MSHKIQDIEGVGPSYSKLLAKAHINTVESLLDTCCNESGRQELSKQTGLSENMLLKWVNMADLMRINGVGGEFAELLEAAGVDTVKELRHRNAESLAEKMKEINSQKHLTRIVPSAKTVSGWIEQAGKISAVVTH